jgi:hypothetical protein
MNSQGPTTPGTVPNTTHHVHGNDRPDLSSLHVREDVAMAGRCANVHLPTGRTCAQPERHPGSCEFVNPGDVENTAEH